jgi:hypothetical protein
MGLELAQYSKPSTRELRQYTAAASYAPTHPPTHPPTCKAPRTRDGIRRAPMRSHGRLQEHADVSIALGRAARVQHQLPAGGAGR